MELWREREIVFNGRIFNVESGLVELDSGDTARRDIVAHPGGVAIVAEHDCAILLVRQFRVAVGQYVLELPAGTLEGDEKPEERARAELMEETGFVAGALSRVADLYASPGYTTERLLVYLATDLSFAGQRPEREERIEVVQMPVSEVVRHLMNGGFRDAKTIAGLWNVLSRTGRIQAGR